MEFLPLDMNYLTEEIIRKAEKELGETPEKRKEALVAMRNCIREDTKLHCPTDDHYLLQYLRARKFNVKRAMTLLQNYYQAKKAQKDVFGKTDFESLRTNISDKIVTLLPYRNEDGSSIFIVQLRYWNAHEMKFATFLHAVISFLIGCVDLYPASQICGVTLILDAKGLGINHIRHMPPRLLHFIARGVTNAIPVRIKAIHVFNESFIIAYVWNLLKMILSDKIKKRVYFHSTSAESLHKCVNPAVLPEDFGGTFNYDYNFFLKIVEDVEDRYYELMSYGYKSRKCSKQDHLEHKQGGRELNKDASVH